MKILRLEVASSLISNGGIDDMIDNLVKHLYNITDAEYDFIIGCASDLELDVFVLALGTDDGPADFKTRRQAILIRDKYLAEFNQDSETV
jgi:hypothetical protein